MKNPTVRVLPVLAANLPSSALPEKSRRSPNRVKPFDPSRPATSNVAGKPSVDPKKT